MISGLLSPPSSQIQWGSGHGFALISTPALYVPVALPSIPEAGLNTPLSALHGVWFWKCSPKWAEGRSWIKRVKFGAIETRAEI